MSEPTTIERSKPESLLTDEERAFRLSPEEAATINAKVRIRLIGVVHGRPFARPHALIGDELSAPTPLEYQGVEDEIRKLKPERGDTLFVETGGQDKRMTDLLDWVRRQVDNYGESHAVWTIEGSRDFGNIDNHMYGAELATALGVPAYGADISEERLGQLEKQTGLNPDQLNTDPKLSTDFTNLRTYSALRTVIEKAKDLPEVAPDDRPEFLIQWGGGHFTEDPDVGDTLPEVFTRQGLECEAEQLPNNMDERRAKIEAALARDAMKRAMGSAIDDMFARIDAQRIKDKE